MVQDFLTYINQQRLFQTSDRLLLTLSGGLDSVVLTELCQRAGLNFGIAHCNFQLRGQESEGDETFVRDLAAQLNAPFYTQRFEVEEFKAKNGVSTQMAARELRYEWFEELRQQHNYDYILTAHHQDDQLETILLNLARGTGLAGLRGILPKNNFLRRPLLFANRAEVLAFALENNLPWREDSSNQSDDYQRNLLRHRVLPVLQQINPNVVQSVAETARRMAAMEQIWQETLQNTRQTVLKREGAVVLVSYEKLSQFSEPLERLAGLLRDYGFSYEQTQRIWDSRDGQAGKTFLSSLHTLTKDRGVFMVTIGGVGAGQTWKLLISGADQTSEFLGGILEQTRFQKTEDLVFEKNPNVWYVDAQKLLFPLTLRPWRAGDWFCPLGMGGKRKKVSDFLIDQKVPLALKSQVLVLESATEIVGLLGFRADERFKVQGDTEGIICFRYVVVSDLKSETIGVGI